MPNIIDKVFKAVKSTNKKTAPPQLDAAPVSYYQDPSTFVDDGDPDYLYDKKRRRYDPRRWPSKFHHKCDAEWCGYANKPKERAGHYPCGDRRCCGNYHVTPEMAAASVLYNRDAGKRAKEKQDEKQERVVANAAVTRHLNKTLDTASDHGEFLANCGASALEYRRQRRAPSISTVATAPAFVRFPQQKEDPYYVNTLHPYATSTLRGFGPSPEKTRRGRPRPDDRTNEPIISPIQSGILPIPPRREPCPSLSTPATFNRHRPPPPVELNIKYSYTAADHYPANRYF